MPELPEVETIRRALEKPLEGRRIVEAKLNLPRLLLGMKPGPFEKRLAGQRMTAVVRRGKYLVLELEADALVVHLGMTGQLTHAAADAPLDPRFRTTVTGLQKPYGAHPVDKHTHLLLRLDDGSRVMFRDPRTFGKLLLLPKSDWQHHPRLGKLGPEPLTMNPVAHAKDIPGASQRPVKALLLDQEFLAGVGNIYADEALFLTGVHPTRKVSTLTDTEKVELLKNVQVVLKKGIKYQGTTFSDYRKPDGGKGDNYERLQAYGRGGKPCRACETSLVKTVVAQRGTVFCPVCQPVGTKVSGKGYPVSARKTGNKARHKPPKTAKKVPKKSSPNGR